MIPHDKCLHALGGALISAGCMIFTTPVTAMLVVTIIGAAKEVWDYKHIDSHTPDIYDWVATILGGLIPLIPKLGEVLQWAI